MDQDMIEFYRWSDDDSKRKSGETKRLLTVHNPLLLDIGEVGIDPFMVQGVNAGHKGWLLVFCRLIFLSLTICRGVVVPKLRCRKNA
jgi:hypothetical protein